MTIIEALVSTIACLCMDLATENDKLACFDKYNNCAVTQNGIMDRKTFIKVCKPPVDLLGCTKDMFTKGEQK